MKAFRTVYTVVLLIVLAMAVATPAAAQSYGSFRDTGAGLVSTQQWCWEATQMAGADACIKRSAANTLSSTARIITVAPTTTQAGFNLQPGVAPSTSAIGDFWLDSTQKAPAMAVNTAGVNEYFVRTLGTYQGTTAVPITDTAFHVLGGPIAIPLAEINVVGKKVRIHGSGVYTTGAASLLNLEVSLCTVSGCATGTILTPAGCTFVTTNQANVLANAQFEFDCTLTTATTGATGTLMAKGKVGANLAAATTGAYSYFGDTATAASAAVDLTSLEYVQPQFKFSTSNAGNSATLQEHSVEILN